MVSACSWRTASRECHEFVSSRLRFNNLLLQTKGRQTESSKEAAHCLNKIESHNLSYLFESRELHIVLCLSE